MIFIVSFGLNSSFFELLCERQEQASQFWHLWVDRDPQDWPSEYILHSWGWMGTQGHIHESHVLEIRDNVFQDIFLLPRSWFLQTLSRMQANVFISFLSLSFIPACVRVGPGWDDNYFPLLTHRDFRLQIREGKNHIVSLSLSLSFFFFQHNSPSSWFVLGIVGAAGEAASPTNAAPLHQPRFEKSYRIFPWRVKIQSASPIVCLAFSSNTWDSQHPLDQM